MFKSKLVSLFSVLNRQEINQFGRYLGSSYFNRDASVVALYQLLKKIEPDFENPKLKKEKVHQKLFGGPFDGKKIRDLMAKLTVLLEDFVVLNQLESDRYKRDEFLLNFYKNRHLDKYYFRIIDRMIEVQSKQPNRSKAYYYKDYKINNYLYQHDSTPKLEVYIKSLNKAVDSLEIFYKISRLKFVCEQINRNKLLNEQNVIPDISLFEMEISTEERSEVPVLEFYLELAFLLSNNERADYEKCRDLYFDNLVAFEPGEQQDSLIFLINYGIAMAFREGEVFQREVLNLYKFGLEKKVLLSAGPSLQSNLFRNIVDIGLVLKELDWVEDFISEYTSLLTDQNRENTVQLAKANLAFVKEEFETVLDLLQRIEFTDVYYNLKAKSILLRTYYLLDSYDEVLFNFINAFSNYIRSNKVLSDQVKEIYLHQIKFVRKLYRFRNGSKLKKEDILADFEQHPKMAGRSWVKKQINLLK